MLFMMAVSTSDRISKDINETINLFVVPFPGISAKYLICEHVTEGWRDMLYVNGGLNPKGPILCFYAHPCRRAMRQFKDLNEYPIEKITCDLFFLSPQKLYSIAFPSSEDGGRKENNKAKLKNKIKNQRRNGHILNTFSFHIFFLS